MRRTRLILSGLLLLVLLPGCGGCGRERDKNKDFDRPEGQYRPVEKK